MTRGSARLRHAARAALLALPLLAACPRPKMVLELQGRVLYEKPRIESVTHTVTDWRGESGSVTVEIVMTGDPGLAASFDITPGIATRRTMDETEPGRYVGHLAFPPDVTGGPFTILGRLVHERAGEAVRRDPEPVTITLFFD